MIKIGQQFAEERKRKSLTIAEVSRATKIREEFLSAIERGEYKKLPSPAYAYGFVRNYAKFLGLPVEKSLAIFRREFDDKKAYEVLPKGLARNDEIKVNKFRFGRTSVLVTLTLVSIISFLLFQYRSAFLNPGISIYEPKQNSTLNSINVNVRGKTDPNAILTINDEPASIKSDGTFSKEITVFPGESTISFKVENKFGRTTFIERHVTVKSGT